MLYSLRYRDSVSPFFKRLKVYSIYQLIFIRSSWLIWKILVRLISIPKVNIAYVCSNRQNYKLRLQTVRFDNNYGKGLIEQYAYRIWEFFPLEIKTAISFGNLKSLVNNYVMKNEQCYENTFKFLLI